MAAILSVVSFFFCLDNVPLVLQIPLGLSPIRSGIKCRSLSSAGIRHSVVVKVYVVSDFFLLMYFFFWRFFRRYLFPSPEFIKAEFSRGPPPGSPTSDPNGDADALFTSFIGWRRPSVHLFFPFLFPFFFGRGCACCYSFFEI